MTDAVAARSTGRCLKKRTAPACVWLVASTFAALALAGCASLGNPPASPRDDALYANSQSNLVSLPEVVEKHPDAPQAYNMRGSVLGGAGRQEQALADFNKAISLAPHYAPAQANRALVYPDARRVGFALADYNRALALDGSYASAYLGRGIVHRQQGHGAQALHDFNKAIALKPDNAQAYYNRGLLYQGQRQHQFAIDDF